MSRRTLDTLFRNMHLSKGGNHKVTEKTETFSGQHKLSVTARQPLRKHSRRWQPKSSAGTQGPTGGNMTAEEREQFEAGRAAAEAAIAAYHLKAANAHTSH